MTKGERKKYLNDANLTKEKFKSKRKEKTGGTSNKEKLKNKPLSMVRPKKNNCDALAKYSVKIMINMYKKNF